MKLLHWLKANAPKRETLERSPLLRPLAHALGDPNVWHFNRRSVARGVALGLFFGFAIPFAQAFAAAFFAVPVRANLAVAALCTFISNPLTTPLIYVGAYEIGAKLLQMQGDVASIADFTADNWFEQLTLLVTSAPLPVALGLLLVSVLSAALGFAVIHFVWRIWIRQRWAARRERRLAAA